MAWNLRTAGHDWIVVLDRSRWLIAAARSAAPSRLAKLSSSRPKPRHEIDVYLDALEAVGIRTPFNVPRLTPGSEARESAVAALGDVEQKLVVLQPGGAENPGATMLDKRWPAERYIQLARTLAERGLRPVLTGGPSDVDLCFQIANDIIDLKPVVLAGRLDIMSSAAVIERAGLYVGADTGMSHLAAAVGAPSIVIFGPTNPLRYAPRGDRVKILSPESSQTLPDIDLRKGAALTGLPSTAEVSVDEVVNACADLIEQST
jgi:ADP-heptose:LPS heptosyltransferase